MYYCTAAKSNRGKEFLFPYKSDSEVSLYINTEVTASVTVAFSYPGTDPDNKVITKTSPVAVKFEKWNLNGKRLINISQNFCSS